MQLNRINCIAQSMNGCFFFVNALFYSLRIRFIAMCINVCLYTCIMYIQNPLVHAVVYYIYKHIHERQAKLSNISKSRHNKNRLSNNIVQGNQKRRTKKERKLHNFVCISGNSITNHNNICESVFIRLCLFLENC